MQRQPRIPGVRRKPIAGAVLREIDERLEETCRRFRVSRSFVVAVALAEFFGLEVDTWRER